MGAKKLKNKIIILVIAFCMVSTSTIITAEKTNKNISSNNSIFETKEGDVISEIIEQIDQEMMLNYIEDLVEIANKYDVSRLTGTEGCEEARDYILDELFDMGYNPKILDWAREGIIPPYKHLLFVSENIEAAIPGKGDSNQIIVLMAHYDTTSITPSADDNSAGVAAVLSAAKAMSNYDFNHEIRFLLVSGEEEGLLGSSSYAQNSYETCESIVNVVNLDMIGYSSPDIEGDENKIRVYETCSEKITSEVVDICRNPDYSQLLDFQVIASDDDTGHVSDQRSFCEEGFNSIFIHEYTWNDNKDTGTDTIENMDVEYATRAARLATAVVASYGLKPILDNNPPESPSKVEGPDESEINKELSYQTQTTDPDGDQVYYMFDWDDGTHSEWLGPYESGETCTATHTYTKEGEYRVKAKAKDTYDVQSSWKRSEENMRLELMFLRNILNNFPFLQKILINYLS